VELSTLTVPIQVSPVIGISCLGPPMFGLGVESLSSDFFLFFRYSDRELFAVARSSA